MTKASCKFHLLQGACSSPVVCSAPLFLPCSLQGYRLRCLCPGRNAAWPQRAAASDSLSRTSAAAMMHCRSDPASREGRGMPRPYGAGVRSLRRSRISGAPRRADTVRAGLQERVRRVVLHRIRETHTILADQWRHECDANISIIARDLSSARFIGARSASPASSPIAGLARRLPASTTGGIRVTGCYGIQVEPGTGLVCLDAGRSDHLSPFFCFFGDELSEINRRARDLNAAQIS
jgi:hypothetical protein